MSSILVTGAGGNVGSVVARLLAEAGAAPRLAVRPGGSTAGAGPAGAGPAGDAVPFDFTDPGTWGRALAGAESLFLVRPPALGNVTRDLLPALAAARDAGVGHVVFLSLQGAERNRVVPHATVEAWLRSSGMAWTFVRPSFFHQNLSTTHAADIRDRGALMVPAGRGRTAFVDVHDVGAVAAAALLRPAEHRYRAWTVTGPRALTYDEVADVLTRELGRRIVYERPGVLAYARHARRRLGMSAGMALVTSAIYTTARLGMAGGLTDDVRTVLGRDPIDLADFARRERAVWLPEVAGSAAPAH